MSSKAKAYIALLTICIVWGVTWVVSRHAIRVGGFPPLQLTSLRQTIGGLCFVGFFLGKGFKLPKPNEWKRLIVLSFLMFVCANGLSTFGVVSVGSGLGSIIGALTIFWLAIFGYFILKQKLSRTTIIGLIVSFIGLLVVFYHHLPKFANAAFTLGIVFSVIATITWALGTIYTVKYAAKGNIYYNVGWQMLLSGVMLHLLSYLQPRVALSTIHYWGWIDLVILVLGGSVLCFFCYMYLLKKIPAAQASIYVYINPIIAMIISSQIFEDEALAPTIVVGSIITLIGVYLVNSSFKVKSEA